MDFVVIHRTIKILLTSYQLRMSASVTKDVKIYLVVQLLLLTVRLWLDCLIVIYIVTDRTFKEMGTQMFFATFLRVRTRTLLVINYKSNKLRAFLLNPDEYLIFDNFQSKETPLNLRQHIFQK